MTNSESFSVFKSCIITCRRRGLNAVRTGREESGKEGNKLELNWLGGCS